MPEPNKRDIMRKKMNQNRPYVVNIGVIPTQSRQVLSL